MRGSEMGSWRSYRCEGIEDEPVELEESSARWSCSCKLQVSKVGGRNPGMGSMEVNRLLQIHDSNTRWMSS
ncbi:unnamed protein product [Urochloa humidicola]